MAKYNSGFTYNPSTSTGTYYGQADPAATTFVSGISIKQLTYGKSIISWGSFSIDLLISGGSSKYPTYWKLVKTPYGVPDHPDYAKYVTGGDIDQTTPTAKIPSGSVTDSESFFPSGTEVTYSLWVYNTVDWFFAGSVDSLVVYDERNTTLKLMSMLPGIWTGSGLSLGTSGSYPEAYSVETTATNATIINNTIKFTVYDSGQFSLNSNVLVTPSKSRDYYGVGAIVDIDLDNNTLTVDNTYIQAKSVFSGTAKIGVETDLHTFISNFTFYYDKLTQQVDNVYRSSDYRYLPKRYLARALRDLNFSYEPTLGVKFGKSLYRYGNIINSLKGSSLGLEIYTQAFSNTPSNVYIGTNLLLNDSQSSFNNNSVDSWTPTNAFLVSQTYGAVGADLAVNTSPVTPLSNSDITGPQTNYAKISLTSTSATILSYGTSTSTITKTVPVTAGNEYYFSGYVKRKSTNSSGTTSTAGIQAAIQWFDITGAAIGTTVSAPNYGIKVIPTTAGTWYYFESSLYNDQIVAPLNALYAGVQLYISGATSGDIFYIDSLQFTLFPENHDISYGMGAPIYETPRTATLQLDAVRTNLIRNSSFENDVSSWGYLNGYLTLDTTVKYLGNSSCLFTANSTTGAVHSGWMVLDPDTWYTFSAYVQGPTSKTAQVGLEFTFPTNDVSITNQIASVSRTSGSGVTTITTEKYHGYQTNDEVVLSSIDSTVNGKYLVTYLSSTQFTVTTSATTALSITNTSGTAKEVDQNTILQDSYSKYLSPTTNIGYSSATTLTSDSWTRISYTVKSPKYVPDNGLPIAKAIIYFPGTTSAESYWVDACLLEKGKTAKTFFNGSGGDTLTNPLTQLAVATDDCQWEKRVRTNWVDHSVFSNDTTGSAAPRWTNISGATITVSTDQYKVGTKSLKVVATIAGNFANVYTTIKYPAKKVLNTSYTGESLYYGGESVTASAYIYSATAGYYNIVLSDNSGTSISGSIGSIRNLYASKITTNSVDQNYGQYVAANTWTRISQTFTLPRNTTASTIGCRLGIGGPIGTFYIDGVQLEFGRTPTPFIDPASSASVGSINPRDTSYTIYSSYDNLNNSGRSYYWPRRADKVARLGLSILNYLPLGGTAKFIWGNPQPSLWSEVDSSLVPYSSFENGLGQWTTDSSTTTIISHTGIGSLFVDSLASKNKMCGAYSPSWMVVGTSLGSPTTMGVTSPFAPITAATQNHYLSVAIKTGVTNTSTTYRTVSKGDYVVTVTWYKSDKTTTNGTATLNTLTLNGNNSEGSGNTYGVYGNRWNIADGYVTPPAGTAYAKISIVFTPTNPGLTNQFFVDRVILRQA